jgi:hypothetical protein
MRWKSNGQELALDMSKLVHGPESPDLRTESGEMGYSYVSYQTDDIYCSSSETVSLQFIWMEMIILRNCILAADSDCMNMLPNYCTTNNC